tara:strand:+ start:16982 stop:18505 length:1524 start_codon:yes stop_codon:yes gene_type:complete
MINYLNIEDEKKLANDLYYGGGVTKKYSGGGMAAMFSAGGADPSMFQGNYQDMLNQGLDPTRDDMSTLRKGTSWEGENTGAAVSAGAGAVGELIGAFDNDPGYGNADIAAETLKYTAMGASAGPIGAGVGALVGAGIGFIKKSKYKKEKKKAEEKVERQEDLMSYMKVKGEDYDAYYSNGGVINKYASGGETDTVKKVDHTKNSELIALKNNIKDKPGRNIDIKNAVESGYSNLYTEKEIADAIDPMTAYITKKRENMSIEQISQIENTGNLTEDKGLWNEDKGMVWNARNLLDKAVTNVQTASLRPGGSGGNKNLVTTAASEMFALPSINRLIKPGGDLEHIAHDPSDPAGYAHAAMNIIGATPGASLLKGPISKNLPALKNSASKLTSETQQLLTNMVGETGTVAAQSAIPFLHRTEKVLHQGHRAQEIHNSMATGGMTPGAYSHQSNPLAVVDKQGNHTGMELTGGEGVFDKPAMDKIKKLLQGGRFDEVGSFVNNEMKTWKHK